MTIALPMLDIMLPFRLAQGATKRTKFIGAFFPSGALMPGGSNGDWTPDSFEGSPGALAGLFAAHRSNLVIPRGICGSMSHDGVNYDPHWENGPGFLNASLRTYNTESVRSLKSLDQHIAQSVLPNSRIKSLHVGSPDREINDAGNGKLALIFANSFSWANDETPNPNTTVPMELFRKIFGDAGNVANDQKLVRRGQYRKGRLASIIDLVKDQRTNLIKAASSADVATLDQYFTELRQIEVAVQTGCGVENFETLANATNGSRKTNGYATIAEYKAPLQLMQKMIVKAMECDLTSAATVMYMPVVAWETCFIIREIGENTHTLAHDPNGANRDRLRKQVRMWVELFGDLLTEIKSKPGLMDQTIALLGSDMSDGSHIDRNLPLVLAGAGSDLRLGGEVGGPTTDRQHADLLREIATLFGLNVSFGQGIRAAKNQATGILS